MEFYLNIFVVFAGAFIIAYYSLPVIIRISHEKHLFDDPTENRKVHLTSIPNLGGISICAAVLIAYSCSGYANNKLWPYMALGIFILFFSGLKDDLSGITAGKKVLIQIIASGSLLWGGRMMITDLGGVFGLHQISYISGSLLTFFTIIGIINAFNLIDGIDGLAGGIGIMAGLFFGCCFWVAGLLPQALLAFATVGALAAFLFYNFEPASIFMGDTGSQIVGYILAYLTISFVKIGVGNANFPFSNIVPILALVVLIVPIYDTLRVLLMRIIKGKSPFKADRLHIHHQLIDMGFSHRACCYIIYGYNIAIIALCIALARLNISVLLAVILGISVTLFPTAHFKRKFLKKMGVNIPSVRTIKIIERKFGTSPHSVKSGKINQRQQKEYKQDTAV